MSYVTAVPETMAAAAKDLAAVGSTLSEAHIAAAIPTVGLVPAAVDEVSASIAHMFSGYAADFHALAGRAAVFHEDFVQNLTAGAHSYASAEAINVEYLIWLVENAGLWTASRALFDMLASIFPILQAIQQTFVQPVLAILGVALLLLFFVGIGLLSALISFAGQFGL
jgi:PE family